MRDLKADLEVCRNAPAGIWSRVRTLGWTYWTIGVIEDHIARPFEDDEAEAAWDLIESAREGWPEAIRRALAAEAERDALKARLAEVEGKAGRMRTFIEKAHIKLAEHKGAYEWIDEAMHLLGVALESDIGRETLTHTQTMYNALQRADSCLSILRHRGGICWGTLGLPQEHEVDAVIGEIRAALSSSTGRATAEKLRRLEELADAATEFVEGCDVVFAECCTRTCYDASECCGAGCGPRWKP